VTGVAVDEVILVTEQTHHEEPWILLVSKAPLCDEDVAMRSVL
jgi:hypothetical protein